MKYCTMCDTHTNCTDDCKHCIEEEEREYKHPCDYGDCPYDAQYSEDCRYYCGLGVDEDSQDEEEFVQIKLPL